MHNRFVVEHGALWRYVSKTNSDVRIPEPTKWNRPDTNNGRGYTKRQAQEHARSLRKENPKWWKFRVVPLGEAR